MQAASSSAVGSSFSAVILTLQVPSPHMFVFDGRFAASTRGSAELLNGVWAVFLAGPEGIVLQELQRMDARVSRTGTLGPGTYFFSVDAASQVDQNIRGSFVGDGGATGSYDFSLAFTEIDGAPVPEPGSLFLLGTGLVGLFVRGARARTASACRKR